MMSLYCESTTFLIFHNCILMYINNTFKQTVFHCWNFIGNITCLHFLKDRIGIPQFSNLESVKWRTNSNLPSFFKKSLVFIQRISLLSLIIISYYLDLRNFCSIFHYFFQNNQCSIIIKEKTQYILKMIEEKPIVQTVSYKVFMFKRAK